MWRRLDLAVRRGAWSGALGHEAGTLRGRTFGLVGFGHIRELVGKLSGFNLKVLVHDPFVDADAMRSLNVEPATLEHLLSESDVVSLHCPLTPRTRHLIGENQLRLMKPTATLINTSRGPVVDEAALVRALTEGRLAAAGLDVLEQEPPASADHPLFQLDNVVITPHVAGYATGGLERRWKLSVETVLALAAGKWPPSCVNPAVQPRQCSCAEQSRLKQRFQRCFASVAGQPVSGGSWQPQLFATD